MADHKVRIASTWTKMNFAYKKISSAWQVIHTLWIKVSGTWQSVPYTHIIPAGAIALYSGVSTPAGWTAYTSADGRFIVGAGGARAVNDTFGSSSVTIANTLPNAGAHNPYNVFGIEAGGSDPSPYINGQASAGSHGHTYSIGVTAIDAYKDIKLIVCNADTAVLPENAMILGHAALTTTGKNVTNAETGVNRFLRGNSATYGATGGSATGNGNATSSSDGAHGHGTSAHTGGAGDGYGSPCYLYLIQGDHTHTVTANYTLGTYGRGLCTYKANAGGGYLPDNSIMLIAGAVPTGWLLCDGTNGTPDMRDHALKLVDIGSANTQYGNSSNNASVSISTTTNGAHAHLGGGWSSYALGSGHHAVSLNDHTHSDSFNQAIVPPSIALNFIMKAN